MQVCQCGAMAGYPHDPRCPFPLFHDEASAVSKWHREARMYEQTCRDCGVSFPFGPDADRCPSCAAAMVAS